MADEPKIDWNLEKIVGTKAKVRILCELTEIYPLDWSISEIARQTKLSKRIVGETASDLTEQGILKYRTLGHRYFYSLANDTVYNTLVNVEKSLELIEKTRLAMQASSQPKKPGNYIET